MEESRKTTDSPDESLAMVSPTPVTEPPLPATRHVGRNAALFIAAGTGAFLLISGAMTPCVGATRSAQLKWQERQSQIDQAELEAQSQSGESN